MEPPPRYSHHQPLISRSMDNSPLKWKSDMPLYMILCGAQNYRPITAQNCLIRHIFSRTKRATKKVLRNTRSATQQFTGSPPRTPPEPSCTGLAARTREVAGNALMNLPRDLRYKLTNRAPTTLRAALRQTYEL